MRDDGRARIAGGGAGLGAWGTRNFENDAALDWAGDFAGRQELRLLPLAFERRSADPDAALAAAEVVAALHGRPAEDLPSSLTDWSRAVLGAATVTPRRLAALVSGATAAVRDVMGSSATRSLWEETTHLEAWLGVQRELLERLQAEPSSLASYPPAPAPTVPGIWLTSIREIGESSRPVPYHRSSFFDDPPDVSSSTAPGEACRAMRVEIEVTEPFLPEDFLALGEWLAVHPDVTVLVRDTLRGLKWKKSMRADPAVLLNFAKVRRLIVKLESARGTEKVLSHLEKLDSLGLYKMRMKNLETVARLPRLARLELWKTQVDLAPLSDSRGLRLLSIVGSADATSLSAIEGLTGLETLQLIDLPGITALPSMARLTALRRAYVRLEHLKDLTPLGEAPALRELVVVGSAHRWPPESFEFLKEHSTLEKLLFVPTEGSSLEQRYRNLIGLPQPGSVMPVRVF
jgi:hypothetical protein